MPLTPEEQRELATLKAEVAELEPVIRQAQQQPAERQRTKLIIEQPTAAMRNLAAKKTTAMDEIREYGGQLSEIGPQFSFREGIKSPEETRGSGSGFGELGPIAGAVGGAKIGSRFGVAGTVAGGIAGGVAGLIGPETFRAIQNSLGGWLESEDSTAQATAYGDVLLQLKELNALGALTGPDLSFLKSLLTDPTSAQGWAMGKDKLMRQIKHFTEELDSRIKTPDTRKGMSPEDADEAIDSYREEFRRQLDEKETGALRRPDDSLMTGRIRY
ncbi:MAG: hypothetical protein ACREXR_02365 [Gammaproteobacteria bacterium]